MKSNFTLLILFCISLFSFDMFSQDITTTVTGGDYKLNENLTECLTEEQREEVLNDIKSNISHLKSQNRWAQNKAQNRAPKTLFSWPIKMKEDAPYTDVWAISNYVDHDPAFANKVLDYNCGNKTYDTAAGYNHMGVDIFTWPFAWKMMDNNQAEIIAAAPGQIISVRRNRPDRSCEFNNNLWNAVYIQHADGSVAIYGHMKKDSPTSKLVGDTVERGEYLGIVGSSGNSTGPHLHFEVYSEIEMNGIGQDVLVDPFAGDCNTMNTTSWWENQKPYVDPHINAVLTHSALPIYNPCPDQETTNEKNEFASGDTVYFMTYLRDQIAGTRLDLKILKPDGTVLEDWHWDLKEDIVRSQWGWNTILPSIPGEWTWRVAYLGQVVDHKFTMGTLSVQDDEFNAISISPNPFNDVVAIQTGTLIKKVSVIDILGKTVMIKTYGDEPIKDINLESLSKGLYFLRLEGLHNQQKIIKLVKK